MSWMSSIDIRFRQPLNPKFTIEKLISNGWRKNFLPEEEILYLPLGDEGAYDWHGKSGGEWLDILKDLGEKVAKKEEIGIVLHIENTSSQILFKPDYLVVSFNIYNSGRLILRNCGQATDFGWYLSRIMPILISMNDDFSEVRCQDWS